VRNLFYLLHRARRNERGFTLIELLVVVIIIGIIAAVALPRFMGQTDKARENAVLAELRSMKMVVELYNAEEGKLPTASNDATAGTIKTVMNDGGINWGDLEDPWGEAYNYNTGEGWYIIYSNTTETDGGDTYYYFVTDKHTPTKDTLPSGYSTGGVASK
jgi:type II secretion system protein G